MRKLGRKKPQKVIKRPINQILAMFYDLANSRRFEIAIFVLIFLNMLSMGIEHYHQPHAVFFILEVSNAFFTTVFGLESCVKIIGLRYHYFTVPWNVFDFVLVFASIFGILMEDVMIDLPISPTLLRVVRVFRIGRILRLIKVSFLQVSPSSFITNRMSFVLHSFVRLPKESESFCLHWSCPCQRCSTLEHCWR